MSVNEFFKSNYNGNADQSLVEDLVIESIKIYGLDIEFIPYTIVKEDKLYGEDTLLEYNRAYPIEAYLETINGFEGQNDFLNKFGLNIEEKGNLLISMRRFRQGTNYTLYRPREKDLIYLPLTDSLYEITFVEHEKLFHNLGALTTWSIRIDLMNYAHQRIRTGVRYIDRFEDEKTYAVELNLATGTGRYLIAEQVFQGTDLAHATVKATVIHYDRDNKILKVKDLQGFFDNTQTVKGASSGVEYTINTSDEKELVNEPMADNKELKDSVNGSDSIINWSEANPFGNPRK